MRMIEIIEAFKPGIYSSEQAREIGDCAIIAISEVTGLPWDTVWKAAKESYRRTGMNQADIVRTMSKLGWNCDETYWKLLGIQPRRLPSDGAPKAMRVSEAQAYLRAHDPEIRLLCMIYAQRVPHTIAFVDGEFKNTLGVTKARLLTALICRPMGTGVPAGNL